MKEKHDKWVYESQLVEVNETSKISWETRGTFTITHNNTTKTFSTINGVWFCFSSKFFCVTNLN